MTTCSRCGCEVPQYHVYVENELQAVCRACLTPGERIKFPGVTAIGPKTK